MPVFSVRKCSEILKSFGLKKKKTFLRQTQQMVWNLKERHGKNSHSKNPWNNPPIIHISPTLGQLFMLPQLCFTARAEKQLSRCIPSQQTTSDEANRHPGFICTSIRPHNLGSDQLPLLWLVHFLQCHLFSIPLHCECQKYVLQSTSAVTDITSLPRHRTFPLQCAYMSIIFSVFAFIDSVKIPSPRVRLRPSSLLEAAVLFRRRWWTKDFVL